MQTNTNIISPKQNISNLNQQIVILYSTVFFCMIVLVICVYAVYLGVFVRGESLISNFFMIMIIGAAGVWLVRTFRSLEAIKEQLKNAEKEDENNATNKENVQRIIVPLSQEDIKTLKEANGSVYIICCVLLVMFSVVFFTEYFLSGKFNWIFALIVFLLIIGVIVIWCVTYMKLQAELKLGQKEVFMGILIDKTEIYHKKSASESSSISSTGTYSRYFYIDGQQIQIDNFVRYEKVQIGQKIILQRSLKSKFVLSIDVVNETE